MQEMTCWCLLEGERKGTWKVSCYHPCDVLLPPLHPLWIIRGKWFSLLCQYRSTSYLHVFSLCNIECVLSWVISSMSVDMFRSPNFVNANSGHISINAQIIVMRRPYLPMQVSGALMWVHPECSWEIRVWPTIPEGSQSLFLHQMSASALLSSVSTEEVILERSPWYQHWHFQRMGSRSTSTPTTTRRTLSSASRSSTAHPESHMAPHESWLQLLNRAPIIL